MGIWTYIFHSRRLRHQRISFIRNPWIYGRESRHDPSITIAPARNEHSSYLDQRTSSLVSFATSTHFGDIQTEILIFLCCHLFVHSSVGIANMDAISPGEGFLRGVGIEGIEFSFPKSCCNRPKLI